MRTTRVTSAVPCESSATAQALRRSKERKPHPRQCAGLTEHPISGSSNPATTMQAIASLATAPCQAAQLGNVVGSQRQKLAFKAPMCGQQRSLNARQARRAAVAAAASREAAPSSPTPAGSGSVPAPSAAAPAGLLQRMVATCSLKDSSTLLLAAALGGCALLGAAEPALAAAAAAGGGDAAGGQPQLLGDLAENADFWGNVLRYVSYFFSVLLGTAYIAIKPIIELMKRPTTAVLVVAGLVGLVYFVSFTVQAMLGVNDPFDYTASSIVTPIA